MPVDFGTEDDPHVPDFGHEDDVIVGEPGTEQATPEELAQWEGPAQEAPGFFTGLGRGLKAPFAGAGRGVGIPVLSDETLKGNLLHEYAKSQGEEPATKAGRVGEFIGGLAGSLGQYAGTAALGGIAGPMASFGSAGAYQAFQRAGQRALAEGKTPDEALNIAKGASGIGALTGAAYGIIPGGPVIRSALTGGAAMGAGTAVENLAERGLGLNTPIMEGVGEAALTGGLIPVGAAAGARGYRALRSRFGKPLTPGTPNAEGIREDTGQPQEAGQVVEGGEANRRNDLEQTPPGEPQPVAAREELQAQAPQATQEQARVLLTDAEPGTAKWTRATEFLKTPEGQAAAESRPVEWSEFYKTDEAGNRSFDVPKLRESLETGKIVSSPESSALLLNMLKESDLHPIKEIVPLEFTPEEAGLISGEKAGFSGRFRIKKGEREGMIDLVQKADNGEPVTQSDFVHHLTHELFHNNVTSKVRDASPEVKSEIDRLYKLGQNAAKGTPHEGHYGMTNPSDFIAELSDKSHWDFLNSIKDGDKTVLQRAWDVVKKLFHFGDTIKDAFGREVKIGSALESLLKTTEKLEKTRRGEVPLESTEFSRTPEEEAQKYTSATSDLGGQMLAGIPNPVAVARSVANLARAATPAVKNAFKAVVDFGKEVKKENLSIEKMDDLDRSVLNWSGKLQRSFGEASEAQREIQSTVKDPAQRDGITNWIQAGGDTAELQRRAAATTDPKLKAGYEAALNLSPEALKQAQEIKATFDTLGTRGEQHGILNSFRDNYVTQIWNLGKGFFAGGTGRTLKERFKFAKARAFDSYFEGEQAGFEPKTKDISKILPVYIHEMNSVIAGRQMVKQMSDGVGSDGRPLLVPKPDTIINLEETPGDKTTLIKPRQPEDTKGYKTMPDQPALQKWVWAGKDEAGNPVFQKAELMVHPEAYKKLKAVLGWSKIREWYQSEGSSTMAIPKAIAQGLDYWQGEMKRTMLGLFAPFHQVQEGTHAIGHRVNPFFNIPKPNMENRFQFDAAKHGLMIFPDRASERQFMEGMRPSGLVSRIPVIGKAADWYSNYLFHHYIPGLKIKTYEAVLNRNMKVYEKDLQANKVSREDVKMLSAQQVNAAYGHLNYAKLGRDPTMQHIAQLALLAPDFLEARTRFAGQSLKGVTGAKVGREQLLALATLAMAQATAAYTMSKLMDGEWDGKHPFEFRKGNRKYTMRSVPEDMLRLITDSRAFIYNRLNPLIGKTGMELITGRDWRGQKIGVGTIAKHAATAGVPLTARGFLGIDESPLKEWEQLAGAAGIKIMRYSPEAEIHQLYADWQKKSGNKKLVAQAEQKEASTFPTSDYYELRQALEKEDYKKAKEEYRKLIETKDPKLVNRVMKPYRIDVDTGALHERIVPKDVESRFIGSLTDEQKKVYLQAQAHRRLLYARFQAMVSGKTE